MTEAEWLESADIWRMMNFVRDRTEDRKVRLFAVACCRRIWDQLTDNRSRQAVVSAERFADGLASIEELEQADIGARNAWRGVTQSHRRAAAEVAALRGDVRRNPPFRPVAVATAVIWSLVRERVKDVSRDLEARAIAEDWAKGEILAILRHIIGNPFRAYPAPASWPGDVVHLADAMYAGQDCHHFALHDALLEAGHEELAQHFREPGHPKGCWALDLILGKS